MAEHIRFSHYFVCTHCLSPIVLLEREVEHPPRYVNCAECGHAEPFSVAEVREYRPGP
jgi:hypothetical protein